MPDVVCHDVTSADLQGSTLVLGVCDMFVARLLIHETYFQGGGERGVLVPDIEMGNALQMLPTGNSVLTIKLDNVSVLPSPMVRDTLT